MKDNFCFIDRVNYSKKPADKNLGFKKLLG